MKTNNTKVGGIRIIDVCNNKAEELEKRYNDLQNRKVQLLAELEKIEREVLYLRAKEVHNVCDYLRTYSRAGTINNRDIDTYLCHCQNMLCGNIDGIFLKFKEE